MKFPTSGLLSKWGFGDGDMLDDLLWDNGFFDHEIDASIPDDDFDTIGFAHRVLIRVVREHVLPAIEQDVEAQDIHTIHNPIRAKTVNGEAWGQRMYEPVAGGGALTPELVEVPDEVILTIAREEASA